MAVLQQIVGHPPFPTHEVREGKTTVGRQQDCDIVLPSPAISRRHALITFQNSRYFIEDLRSRNGTQINGCPVQQRTMLNDGDQIELSTLSFTFLSENSLTELSGSWGVKPDVICVSQAGSSMDASIRRQMIQPGDRITSEQLGSDAIREKQITARIQLGDGAGGWPVTQAAAEKLNHVLRLIHLLRGVNHRDTVITHTLECLFEVFPNAERLTIVVRDDSGEGIQVAAAVARVKTGAIEVCLPVVRTAIQNAEGLLYVDHLSGGENGVGEAQQPVMRTILAVPLLTVGGENLGAVQLDGDNRQKPLSKDDLEKAVVLGQVIAFALEQSAGLEATVQRAVAERSHADARELRTQLSPTHGPAIRGYEIAHRVLPSPDIAADLVDYTRLPDGRVACILIDVPGRGSKATSMMALLSRLLCESVAETGSPAAAIREAVRMLRHRLSSVPMVTSVAVSILDPSGSTVTVSVAGHCPVLVVRGNEIEDTETRQIAGSPLDVDGEILQETQFELADNDVVLIFADGVTRVASGNGNTLSRAELFEKIRTAAEADRSVFTSKLARLLEDYRADTPLTDDVSFLTIRRNPDADTVDVPGSQSSTEATN